MTMTAVSPQSPTMAWCDHCHASRQVDIITNVEVRVYYLHCGHIVERAS